MTNLIPKLAIALLLSGVPLSATVVLSLYPNNVIASAPPYTLSGNGEVLGVGFQIENTSTTDYILFTGVNPTTGNSPTLTANGSYLDLSPFGNGPNQNNNLVLAPGDVFNSPYVSNGSSGFLQYTFNASPIAFLGPTLTFVLGFDIFDADPFTGGNQLASDFVSTSITFNTSEPLPNNIIPEPSSFLLLGTGVAALYLARRRS